MAGLDEPGREGVGNGAGGEGEGANVTQGGDTGEPDQGRTGRQGRTPQGTVTPSYSYCTASLTRVESQFGGQGCPQQAGEGGRELGSGEADWQGDKCGGRGAAAPVTGCRGGVRGGAWCLGLADFAMAWKWKCQSC